MTSPSHDEATACPYCDSEGEVAMLSRALLAVAAVSSADDEAVLQALALTTATILASLEPEDDEGWVNAFTKDVKTLADGFREREDQGDAVEAAAAAMGPVQGGMN